MNLSQVLHTVLMVGVLSFIASYTTIASAAQHCGHGFHRNAHGRYIANHRVQ